MTSPNPFQQFNEELEQFGRRMGKFISLPQPGTSIATRMALLSLEGVQEVLVEGPRDRKIVPEGHVRITVHGGFAEEIAERLYEVTPVATTTDGFTGAESSTGVWYWFDHVEPSVRYTPPPRPWYRRLWAWIRGGLPWGG